MKRKPADYLDSKCVSRSTCAPGSGLIGPLGVVPAY
jgi:hypothetical protein